MAVEKLEIETYFGKCKCCLQFGYLRPMWDEHDENEVYGKMLTQCFSIPWTIESSEEEDQICEDCIWKLKEANKFKQQILQSRDQNIKVDCEVIKPEPEESYDVEYLDEDLLLKNVEETETNEQNGDYDVDYLEDIETGDDDNENDYGEAHFDEDEEDEDEDYKDSETSRSTSRKRVPRSGDTSEADTPKSKWPKKLPLQERWKTYRQYTDDDMKLAIAEVMNKSISQRQASIKFNVPVKTLGARIKAIKNLEEARPSDSEDKTKGDDETPAVIQKHRENLQSVLAYSNATPIRGFWGLGYVCSICPHQFGSASELKIHTQTHRDLPQLFKIHHVRGHIARLDITDLKCNLCNTKFEKLQSLMQHLKIIHGKPMHFDMNNHMIPFKFDSDLLECADCSELFKHCKTLSEHMANKHYRNYVCNECDKGFFNLSHLAGHRDTHQSGEFHCSKCGKLFTTLRKKTKHERLHATRGKHHKCKFCELWFYNATQTYNHELRMHPNDKSKFDCGYCDKTYYVLKNLRVHINECHLDRKMHECPVETCKKSFYHKRTLKAHIKQHGLKLFQCLECFRMFRSSVTLRSHMLIHGSERERKFKCEECDVSYLKKDNLNRHMKKYHECDSNNTYYLLFSEKKEINEDPTETSTFAAEMRTLLRYFNFIPFRNRAALTTCYYCSTRREFDSPSEMRTHIRLQHPDQPDQIEIALRPSWSNELVKLDIHNLKCIVCNQQLTWQQIFTHLEDYHATTITCKNKLLPFDLSTDHKCVHCTESFISITQLDWHMNKHYPNYICGHCGEPFASLARFRAHERTHRTGRYPCTVCNKVFALQKYMTKHIALKHMKVKKIKCFYCGEAFVTETNRHAHIAKEHSEHVQIYTCEVCGETFDWLRTFTRHMTRRHSTQFYCKICSKSFMSSKALDYHNTIHNGDSFECPICQRCYSSFNTLKSHVKFSHKNQPKTVKGIFGIH